MATEQFRTVGEFTPPRPPLTKMPRNPIDKATIVSIYPNLIVERKNTIEPGIFEIPAGRFDNPSSLVVGTSSWWSYSGDTRPTIEVPISAVSIADSLIKDLAFDFSSAEAGPGLFFIPGEIGMPEIKFKYKSALEAANERQRAWFMVLVRIADSLWARAHGNPLCISDAMRLAARELNINEKPWLKDYQTIELVPCEYCGTLKNPVYPICANCKAISSSYTGPEIKRME